VNTIMPDGGVLSTPADRLSAAVIKHGACVGSPNPDDWFPPEPDHNTQESARARQRYEEHARRLCSGCPVQMQCLEYALRIEAALPLTWIHGIYGGTAPWQRARIIRYRRRAAMRKVG